MTTIFKKIIDKEIPAKIVYEDSEALAFHDVHPQAPTHILIVPKREIAKLADLSAGDKGLMGHLFWVAIEIARKQNLQDYRLVINNGPGAGQTVFHLHLHLLAGRAMNWPPG